MVTNESGNDNFAVYFNSRELHRHGGGDSWSSSVK
jgi:hypothetical protein